MNAKEYILKNYDKYGLLTQNNQPITQRDMLELLNILESQNETLDSLHDAAFNGYTEFMDIWHGCPFQDDNDTYHAIIDKFTFFTENEFIEWAIETATEGDGVEYLRQLAFDDFCDNVLYKTSDGYVLRYYF